MFYCLHQAYGYKTITYFIKILPLETYALDYID